MFNISTTEQTPTIFSRLCVPLCDKLNFLLKYSVDESYDTSLMTLLFINTLVSVNPYIYLSSIPILFL